MSKQMLKELLNVFEKEFRFTCINDEEVDKGDEVELDETVVLEAWR